MATSSTPAQYALILIDLARERGIAEADLCAGSSLADIRRRRHRRPGTDSDFRTLATMPCA
jgi:hypothetical protein